MKKAVMIIALQNFRDEELLEPKKILEDTGIAVTIASTAKSTAKGKLGAEVVPDALVKEIKANDCDALIFVGGPGASCYFDDPVAHALAQQAVALKKVLAAICIAPVILARAGVLKGIKATVWQTEGEYLEKMGAVYTGRSVERDGLIVTGNGPAAAREFGKTIVSLLNS